MVLLQDQVHLEQTSTEQIRVPERTMVLESSVPTSSNPNPFLCMKFQRIDIATLLSLSSLLVGIKAACTETAYMVMACGHSTCRATLLAPSYTHPLLISSR